MQKKILIKSLKKIIQSKDISDLQIEQISNFFLEEEGIRAFAPDGFCQMDPRNGDWIVYNSARACRPHDNLPENSVTPQKSDERECMICQGKTTQVLDVAALSEGFTFINKNLYPIFYPKEIINQETLATPEARHGGKGISVQGYHFLQWTSSFHDKDWHNMPRGDRIIVLQRLAALEKRMLTSPEVYVSIIKNYGHLVGGSLAHGHQQIAVSNIMPNRIYQNRKFQQEHGETFSTYMLRENSPALIIRDYDLAVLMTPYFMRRPFDMVLLIKDATKSYLHSLDKKEMEAVADGWQDAIRFILSVMPRIGKEVAYNVVTHNGPGAGLYFEFLPYTQEMGGFEHLGLYLCQGNPLESAQIARKFLDGNGK